VLVRQVDIADQAALAAVVNEIQATMPPLRGVFHLAGILDDATLLTESSQHLRTVMAPKVHGAWNLHRLTATADLDLFVLFSSAAAVVGGPGQGAYAAANAAMDGLAHYRRGRGLPATSLNWGPWAGGGLADSAGAGQPRWQAWGIGALRPEEGLRYLEMVLSRPGAQTVIMPWDLTAVASQAANLPPFFARLLPAAAPAIIEEANKWREKLVQAAPSRRRALLIQELENQVRHVLRLPASLALDEERPLHELGLDSLMAVELRNTVVKVTGETLPVTLLFDYPSLGEMADYLLDHVLQLEAGPSAGRDAPADPLAAEIAALSEEEAVARLIANLNRNHE
jgi:acyl carrier protein